MRRGWELLTRRGRFLVVVGLTTVLVSMLAGQRDVLRLGLLLLVLPVLAAVLVARARVRMTCERAVEPAQVPLGTPLRGKITLGQDGRLPAAILMMEDAVPAQLGSNPRFLVDGANQSWRREVEYPLLGRVRGRFTTGPLLVRTTDPFGLVTLDRQFSATSDVMVTPHVVPLPKMRTAGGAGSTGEAQPHRVGVVGQDDVLVRDYQQGDDVRRVHWRSTARRGELMVRREEQAWDPSASILLDTRATAHVGVGMSSSLEWAVSAAASIATHFVDDGFGVEIYEAEGPMRVNGRQGQHSSATRELVVSRLTDVQPRVTATLHYAIEAATVDQPGQLVIAILGRVDAEDAHALLRIRRNRAQALALMIDVDGYTNPPGTYRRGSGIGRSRTESDVAAEILRDNQWRVVQVPPGMGVAEAWASLEQLGAPV